jgi:4-amino-4-deoxy-L-arabinose transferase-like glycosyltransferase
VTVAIADAARERPAADPPRPAAEAARYDAAALALLAGLALFHAGYSGLLALSPQEAYYWEWSRRLAPSYFDHPPLAAWTIRAATALLGDSERAIRAAAGLHALVFALFFWRAARRMFGARAAVGALAGGLALPLFSLGQVVVTPDGPLLSGWAMALYFTVRALDEERGPWLLGAGAAAGWAMLGKYTGALLLPQILAALLLDARGRRLLRGPWPWIGAVLALALFSPVIAWNAERGWASFAFQTGSRVARSHFRPTLVGRYVGLQAALVTPVVIVLLGDAIAAAVRRRAEAPWRLCVLFSAPLLLFATAVSPFHWVKGNWVAAAYPTAVAAGAALALERRGWRLRAGLAGLSLAALATVYLHLVPLVPALPFPARDEGSAGWRALAARAEAERAALPADAFVAGCNYKVSAELAYYLPGRPRTWSGEIAGDHGLQYRYWLDPAALAGRDGLVVRDRREKRTCERLAEACGSLEPLEPLTVWRGEAKVTTFDLWRCRSYAGPPPAR